MKTTLLNGWIEANATLVGLVIVAVALIAIIYVGMRLRMRGPGGE